MVIVTLPTQGWAFSHSKRLRRLAGISRLAMSKKNGPIPRIPSIAI